MDPGRSRRRNHVTILLSLIAMLASLAFPQAAYADLRWSCEEAGCGSCGFIHCVDQCTDGDEQEDCDSFCSSPCHPGNTFCEDYPGCAPQVALTCACHG